MPMYEYRCSKCSNKFELRRGLAARDEAAPCPACKSKATTRVLFQKFGLLMGARPNAAAGEGESEDFMPGAEEYAELEHQHGHSHGPGGITHDSASRFGPGY